MEAAIELRLGRREIRRTRLATEELCEGEAGEAAAKGAKKVATGGERWIHGGSIYEEEFVAVDEDAAQRGEAVFSGVSGERLQLIFRRLAEENAARGVRGIGG